MRVLGGLITLNGIDIYQRFGVFLTEDKLGANTNYEELLRPAAIKPMVAVSYPDSHGERQPDAPSGLCREPRDIVLYLALTAKDKVSYFRQFEAFFSLLVQGDKGWLDLRLKEIDRLFRLRYMGVQEMEQLTTFADGWVGARFKVKFRESNPLY